VQEFLAKFDFYKKNLYNVKMDYLQMFNSIFPKSIYIHIPDYLVFKCYIFAMQAAGIKPNEPHHWNDDGEEFKRNFHGKLGECAVIIYLGLPISMISFEVGPDSKIFDYADLHKAGYWAGIKSVEYMKLPLIYKKPREPQVIVTISAKYKDKTLIHGIATVENQLKNQDDNLIVSPKVKAAGKKTAFTGLLFLESMDTLNKYKI